MTEKNEQEYLKQIDNIKNNRIIFGLQLDKIRLQKRKRMTADTKSIDLLEARISELEKIVLDLQLHVNTQIKKIKNTQDDDQK